jgi:hypothetical protein
MTQELNNDLVIRIPIATFMKFFYNERIEEVSFTPLIEDNSKDYCINKYEIDWKRFDYNVRIDLLFKFFATNQGSRVEVGVIYGAFNMILEKAVFVVGGRLEKDYIKPLEIISNGYCYNYFHFKNIYYAKVVA